MIITLDISNEEFDAVLGRDDETSPTVFLNFPSDIRGTYEFELLNSVVNIFQFKDQMISQGIDIEDDSLYVYGIMKIRIEKVKGADFELVEGDFFKGRRNFHSWR
ncbi:hypothetical protein [Paenibacillus pedocola]|uniref:hypothetical protein n=1 Tax=Paenibacillus pedocola TaxID=3242193 RepID=UPI002877B118|nr:hypothetical protein [Paenibacillus typhae]